MDKNSLTGLLLIGLLLFGFMLCDRPDARQEAAQKDNTEKVADKGAAADKAAAADLAAAPAGADSAALAAADSVRNARYGAFAPFIANGTPAADNDIVVDNGKIKVTFSALGGCISSVVLPGYKTETVTPARDICLFDASTGSFGLQLETATQRIDTRNLRFRASQPDDSTVVMSLPMGKSELALRYTVVPGQYIVRMDMVQKNMAEVIPANRSAIHLTWSQKMRRNEKGRTFEERNSAVYYKFDNENPDDLNANKDDDEDLTGNLKWVAFKNQFFSSAIIARGHFESARVESKITKEGAFLKEMNMDGVLAYSSANDAPASLALFFGPNDYPMLSDLDETLADFSSTPGEDADLQLNRLVPLGWGIFGWINRFCTIPLFEFLGGFIHNYGWIIIIITLIVKLVLFPLTYKSYRSQAKMRVLAPEIAELNEKYPGQENAMKRQQETMALYSRAGASPFSGCLPLLLQMPVLIAMFSFFPSAIELRGQSFLWAHDLSAPDYIFTLPFSIPFLGNQLSLFCLLMTVVNILYTYINMKNQPTTSSMPGMKWMMYLMPLMFMFFFNDYASGLSLYYFVFLLVTILQMQCFRWFTNEAKLRAEMKENARKPRKKSGFMARLEEAQKRQEAILREQRKAQERRRR